MLKMLDGARKVRGEGPGQLPARVNEVSLLVLPWMKQHDDAPETAKQSVAEGRRPGRRSRQVFRAHPAGYATRPVLGSEARPLPLAVVMPRTFSNVTWNVTQF